MHTNRVSKQEYLDNILQIAADTNRHNSNADWAQHEGMYSRALALLNLRLSIYSDLGDAAGMADTQWAMIHVRRQLSQVK